MLQKVVAALWHPVAVRDKGNNRLCVAATTCSAHVFPGCGEPRQLLLLGSCIP